MVSERPSQEGKLSPGAPNDPVPFGKYYLLGLIARGGMAEVYRARPVSGDRNLFAVKVMRPQLAREARFIDMFNREGKLAMMLKNRCIVETLEIGQHEGRHYIAMEYVPGRDLTQVLRRCQETQQRIPVPHAVFIAARIAEGLHFAHTLTGADGRPLNIVNRDVSPSNVRLSYRGEVKMLDFGIAQALMKFTSEIGVLKGKFSYMSPEQIRGMPVDARTDIFSAGIILHEMLTTEKLFRGDTEFALMEKVRKAEVPPPSNFNRRVTPELDAISLKALARDVADRYQSGAEFAADLNKLLANYRFNPQELREFLR
ncbi:MAG TPA: serine/threonine-protein kinase, partial [Kofleriaceae bacterium]|nr:serine/threonine-protein kinase [Kofleriaceae bacterium]